MDTTPGPDIQLKVSFHQSNTDSIGNSPEADMTKQQNHFFYERANSRKELLSYTRFPKFSLVILRRSWNLKLVLLMIICLATVTGFYSGVISLLVPSFSFNLLLGKNDQIRVPRIAIQLRPSDLKREDFQLDDLIVNIEDRARNNAAAVSKSKDTDDIVQRDGVTNAPKGEKRYPSSIIFGVSKCGTRAVLEYLKLHPDVVAPIAEVNFFNNETLFKRGTKWYLQQMPYARNNQLIVEKSPDYFQTPECAPMIRNLNSDIKLLLLLRDPVERLVSQYMQLLAKNPNLRPFEEWVINPTNQQVNINIPSVMVSAYSKYIEEWLSVFPRDQILIIESNNLRQYPYAEMKRVEQFLNLKPFFEPSDFYFNSTRGFYCLRYRATGKTKCLGKSKGRQHIPVREDVLNLLYSFYGPYNERLNELLGKRFPWS